MNTTARFVRPLLLACLALAACGKQPAAEMTFASGDLTKLASTDVVSPGSVTWPTEQASIDVHSEDDSEAGGGELFDLEAPSDRTARIAKATGFILRCDLGTGCPYQDPIDGKIYLRAAPHGDDWKLDEQDSSYSQWADELTLRYVHGSGSFLADDVVITAKHNMPESALSDGTVYFVMNAAFISETGEYAWTEGRPPSAGADTKRPYVVVDPKYLFRTELRASGSIAGQELPDWLILGLHPWERGAEIPDHPNLCLQRRRPDERVFLVAVPGHPRNLPLKFARGGAWVRIGNSGAIDGWYDSSGGMSGAPLLEDGPFAISDHIVGVHRGHTFPKESKVTDKTYAHVCTAPGLPNCHLQPVTPSDVILDALNSNNFACSD